MYKFLETYEVIITMETKSYINTIKSKKIKRQTNLLDKYRCKILKNISQIQQYEKFSYTMSKWNLFQ